MSMTVLRPRQRGGARQGFTLLELIIVLVVLAALAALVVPTLGFVRDQAKYATAAAGAAEVLNNIELYKSATGNYPQRMDTLVGTDGQYYSKAYSDGGAFPYGAVVDGDEGSIAYMLKNGAGMSSFANHSQTASDPNASTETTPLLTYDEAEDNGADIHFAIIDPEQASGFYVGPAGALVRACYPNQENSSTPQVPPGHYLVALGVGSRASCVGSTMTSAPIWSGAATDQYGRYIALFDVSFSSGRGTVKLKAVTDSEFKTISANVRNYKRSGPTDEQGLVPEEEVPETP